MTSNRKRIFSVDDHPIFRSGLRALCLADGRFDWVGEASTLSDAKLALTSLEADVVLVDVSLPDGNGIELIRSSASVRSDVGFLVLSMYDQADYAVQAMRAGARGFIQKTASPDKIVAAIDKVANGKLALSDATLNELVATLSDHRSARGGTVGGLTSREAEIFELIGRGYTTREIAQALHVSSKTVDTHKSNIMRKLSLRGTVRLQKAAFSWVRHDRSLPRPELKP